MLNLAPHEYNRGSVRGPDVFPPSYGRERPRWCPGLDVLPGATAPDTAFPSPPCCHVPRRPVTVQEADVFQRPQRATKAESPNSSLWRSAAYQLGERNPPRRVRGNASAPVLFGCVARSLQAMSWRRRESNPRIVPHQESRPDRQPAGGPWQRVHSPPVGACSLRYPTPPRGIRYCHARLLDFIGAESRNPSHKIRGSRPSDNR